MSFFLSESKGLNRYRQLWLVSTDISCIYFWQSTVSSSCHECWVVHAQFASLPLTRNKDGIRSPLVFTCSTKLVNSAIFWIGTMFKNHSHRFSSPILSICQYDLNEVCDFTYDYCWASQFGSLYHDLMVQQTPPLEDSISTYH